MIRGLRAQLRRIFGLRTPRSSLPEALTAPIDPDYSDRVHALGVRLRGKVVVDSAGGHSGYLLTFADGTWLAVWLDEGSRRMEFMVGRGSTPPRVMSLLSNPEVPDANNIAAEVRHAHRQAVQGVSIGERAFGIAFPGGMELEGAVREDGEGRVTMRVSWERW